MGDGGGVLGSLRRLVVAASLALPILGVIGASAQDELNCDDFASQAAAQVSLNSTYPYDPHRLDRDHDWIACEDHFGLSAEEAARVIPADVVNRGTRPEPATTPTSVAGATPAPAAVSGARADPPAELMVQVADCEVVAVSSRSIAAAGCPGRGSVILRPAAGTPRMRSQVIIRPGAALGRPGERAATAAQRAEPGARRGNGDRPRKGKQRHHQVGAKDG